MTLLSCTKDNSALNNSNSSVIDAARRGRTSPDHHYFRLSVIHKDKTVTYFNTKEITLTY